MLPTQTLGVLKVRFLYQGASGQQALPAGRQAIIRSWSTTPLRINSYATGKLAVTLTSTWGAPSATLDQSSLTTTSHNRIITGTATNIADLNVQVGEDHYDPHVENGHWATYSPATLTAGTHKVIVRTLDTKENEKVLATGTLVVE